MICCCCHETTRHGTTSQHEKIFLCSRCNPAIVRKIKNANGKYSYFCVYQEWLANDSCHELMKLDTKHEAGGRSYADSLVCPKGHNRIIIGY